ncbi:DUF2169 family type VI secretion system accessory protein [Entomohabitans teleogrylli]|uniref:DUF2169 family type VI secretion system accessory protein n=1 Tax=Entomohabitans teleogrylli TaxID=1384589 RepID=UPI00073D72F8|nr:DUF2169 domain-containing protein [Entomohabitans teleogrylli]
MKIIKPLRLSLLQRPWRWQQKNHLGVAVMGLADMSSAPRLRPETELWQLVESELQPGNSVVDLAIPKACAEFLASGFAYTAHQQQKTACAVKIQVAEKEKTLLAFGERHWVNNVPSQPLPFEQMPLNWSRAFGGPEYADNPHGTGAAPELIDGILIHRLPNIEPLSGQITRPQQKPAPAGFGALDFTWPARFTRIGKKYDRHWLEYEFPGFANDIDWRLFNAAPQDQWWENLDALPERAPWRIWNMHPTIPVQSGILPPWRARCFINRLRADDTLFEEIPLRLTTVWFFPHREQMLLIWHGATRINEDDGADVVHILPALEQAGAQRSTSHYRKVLQQRLDKSRGALFAFREKDLLPENAIGPWLDTEVVAQENPLSANLKARAQQLRDEYRPEHTEEQDISSAFSGTMQHKVPSLDELPEFVERMEQQAEQIRQQSHERLRSQGLDPDNPGGDHPAPRGPENFQRMRDMLHTHATHGLSAQQITQVENALHDTYLMSVQTQSPALKLTGDTAQIIRRRVQATMESDKDFSGLDLTGADLSGLDLRHANFCAAMLESADLSGCQLDGADFTRAMLARCDVVDSSLHNAILEQACLTQANCHGSDFTGAVFHKTQMQEARFEQCIFDQSRWEELMLYRTDIIRCRFHHARITNTLFFELTLPEPDFTHAAMSKAAFIRCRFTRARFAHSRLESCSWVESQLPEAGFQHAELNACAFTVPACMEKTDFSHATLTHCNLRQVALSGACFMMARLDNSDLSEADCQRADMRKMNGAGSLFIRTNLCGAQLNDSNLIGALLQKCRLSGADLRHANLFRTDLSQSLIDATTRLDGAWTTRSKVLPKRDKQRI